MRRSRPICVRIYARTCVCGARRRGKKGIQGGRVDLCAVCAWCLLPFFFVPKAWRRLARELLHCSAQHLESQFFSGGRASGSLGCVCVSVAGCFQPGFSEFIFFSFDEGEWTLTGSVYMKYLYSWFGLMWSRDAWYVRNLYDVLIKSYNRRKIQI